VLAPFAASQIGTGSSECHSGSRLLLDSALVAHARGRLIPIDLVRLASIAVVLAVHLHASGIVTLPGANHARAVWIAFARNGSYGVSLFFVISGFVITRTILRRNPDIGSLDLRGFYVRRAGRILPLWALVLGVAVWGLVTLSDGSPRAAFCVREPLARFDAWFWLSLPTFSFNWLRIAHERIAYGYGLQWDVLWSLAIEEQFYLGYPLALRLLGSRRRVVALLSLVFIGGLAWRWACARLIPTSFLWSFTASPGAFDLIALGCLLCFFLEARPRALRGFGAWIERALGVVGGAGVVATYVFSNLDSPTDRVWGPTAIAVSLALFLAVALRREWLSGSPSAWLSTPGQLSYGAYLCHPMVLFALWPLVSTRAVLPSFSVFLALTLAVAALIYWGFEARVNRLVRRSLGAL
jgi:peptidoglycan/LPS O-acetylase OafA/YrhL